MERLRLRRSARRATPNRNDRRKSAKKVKRQLMVNNKIHSLLHNCPASILDTDILQEEHIKIIKNLWFNATSYDYYPVPKRIHNSIRSYAHNHKVQRGQSLLLALSSSGLGISYQIGNVPTYEGEFSLERIENFLRELDNAAASRTAVRASTPHMEMDWATALRNSNIQFDTESTINPWD